MSTKFHEVTQAIPVIQRSYRQLFNIVHRKHNYDASGKEVDIPQDSKFNALIVSVKKPSDEIIKEKVVLFHGNKLLLSDWQKRQFSCDLRQALARLGEQMFEGDSLHNLIIHSNDAKIKGSYNWIENNEILNPKKEKVPTEDDVFQRRYLTASQLFSYNFCPHKLYRDVHIPPDKNIKPAALLKLLWEKGIQYEEKVIVELGDYEDLSVGTSQERAQKTIDAMQRGVRVIYKGVLVAEGKNRFYFNDDGNLMYKDNSSNEEVNLSVIHPAIIPEEIFSPENVALLGEPALLLRMSDGQYMPFLIKSASAFEGLEDPDTGDRKLKEDYALQLALYDDALIRLGFAKDRRGMVFDNEGREVEYNLDLPRNKRDQRTFWDVYNEKMVRAYKIVVGLAKNDPALFSGCKMCTQHYAACKEWCIENDHTSLVHQIGRSFSDVLRDDANICTVSDLANADVDGLLAQKKDEGGDFLYGIGDKRLGLWVRRAQYIKSGANGVKILEPIIFPKKERELHFDIEADPTQGKGGIVYLHGVIERKGNEIQYHSFVAREVSEEAEKAALKAFWDYVRSLPDDHAAYHYSHYERTMYRKLMEKYPDVITPEELNKFFDPEKCIDLYRVVEDKTDWPSKFYSLKDLAKSIGFRWRDTDPSGASSIEWFNRWVKTGKEEDLQRIIDYNEDDCRAQLVVKDYLEEKMQEYLANLETQLEERDLGLEQGQLFSV